ncbi:hypothetical protein DPMN_007875 [Dreissena polymorpha]|uniref:Uncharacterized protein n=1 Tax=Dreissena polymorpha TaxID=45954 RepID=A0A9D4RZ36_DREPO|nr:hypothetical protein DPMN_007875 [Dreissena polymorpha]
MYRWVDGTCSARWVTHAKSPIWRLSAIASGESVAEGTLTGPSLWSRLSLGTCSARWVTHAKSPIWRLSAIASGESVAEGTLTGPSLWSRLSLGTCSARWVTHAKSPIWRLSAIASGESVAEGTLTCPSLWSRLSLGRGKIIIVGKIIIMGRNIIRKTDPTPGSRVFLRTGTNFELGRDTIRANVLTPFHDHSTKNYYF